MPDKQILSIHVEQLNNVSKGQAALYARDYVRKHHSCSTSYFKIFPVGDSQVVEIQEDGPGFSVLDEVLSDYNGTDEIELIVQTAKRKVMIELAPSGVQTLNLTESDTSEPTIIHPGAPMTAVDMNNYKDLLKSGLLAFAASLLIFFVALTFRPEPEVHVIAEGPGSPLILPSWEASQTTPYGATVKTIRFKHNRFSVESIGGVK